MVIIIINVIVIITAINLITMKMITQVNICRRPARPGESCDTLGLAELGTMCNPKIVTCVSGSNALHRSQAASHSKIFA